MIDPANQGLTAVRDVCDPVPENVESFGIDDGGPLPLHESEDVVVPVTTLPLTSEQLNQLEGVARQSLSSDELGVTTYLQVRDLVYAMLQ